MKPFDLILRLFTHIALVPMLLSLSFAACSMAPKKIVDWPAKEGAVINTETGEPIEGAYVIGHWRGSTFGKTVCFHAEGTRSDSEGRFVFPAWRNEDRFNQTSHQYDTTRAYKRGYREDGGKTYRISMVPFIGSREERLEYLRALAGGCHHAGASNRNLYSFYEAIYLEAKSLAVLPAEVKALNSLQYAVASSAVARDDEMDMDIEEFRRLRESYIREYLQ